MNLATRIAPLWVALASFHYGKYGSYFYMLTMCEEVWTEVDSSPISFPY